MKHAVYNVDNVDIQSYANLVLLQRLYSNLEQRYERRACKKFLREEFEKNGTLTCYYCSKPGLKLETDKAHERATVDHFVPKSAGGSPTDPVNFVVCCNSCNRKKASDDAETFKKSRYICRKTEWK